MLLGFYCVNYCDRPSFCNLKFLEVRKLYNEFCCIEKNVHGHAPLKTFNCIYIHQADYHRGQLISSLQNKTKSQDIRKHLLNTELLTCGILSAIVMLCTLLLQILIPI